MNRVHLPCVADGDPLRRTFHCFGHLTVLGSAVVTALRWPRYLEVRTVT